MRKLTSEKRAAILSALCEGSSVNATVRITCISKVTVQRLLDDAGTFCAQYHDLIVRRSGTKRAQIDELRTQAHGAQDAAGIANKPLTMRDLVLMTKEEDRKLGERLAADYLPRQGDNSEYVTTESFKNAMNCAALARNDGTLSDARGCCARVAPRRIHVVMCR